MAIDKEQGFLGTSMPDISAQTNFGLGEQSALLTPEDLNPSLPYQVTTVQETIPAAPPIAVGGTVDPFAGSDLSTIISPFTDPEQIRERRRKNKLARERIQRYGGADPLFVTEPDLNIASPEVPEFATDVPDLFVENIGDSSPEIVRRQDQFGMETKVYEQPDYQEPTFLDALRAGAKQEIQEQTSGKFQESLESGISKEYQRIIADVYGVSAFGGIQTGLGTTTSLAGGALSAPPPASLAGQNTQLNSVLRQKADMAKYAQQASTYIGYAMAAYSAKNAFDAFKQGDTLGGVTSTITTLAPFVPFLQPVAIALNAVNFVSRITGWGRGKPKPGFGGSEIGLRPDGTFFHDQAYSYNGFDPSGAKKHTDLAMNFLTNYEKELGLKLNYDRAQKAIQEAKVRGGNYLRRVDVSPWKDGSGSASEMIERWLSAGVYDGTPTYYDASAGERRGFQSQQQYEQWMQQFSNRIFKG